MLLESGVHKAITGSISSCIFWSFPRPCTTHLTRSHFVPAGTIAANRYNSWKQLWCLHMIAVLCFGLMLHSGIRHILFSLVVIRKKMKFIAEILDCIILRKMEHTQLQLQFVHSIQKQKVKYFKYWYHSDLNIFQVRKCIQLCKKAKQTVLIWMLQHFFHLSQRYMAGVSQELPARPPDFLRVVLVLAKLRLAQ